MDTEFIKQACKDYLYDTEKVAFPLGGTFNAIKNMAPKVISKATDFMKSPIGKTVGVSTALGAGLGAINPGTSVNPDGTVKQNNRITSAVSNGLMAGGMSALATKGLSAFNKSASEEFSDLKELCKESIYDLND